MCLSRAIQTRLGLRQKHLSEFMTLISCTHIIINFVAIPLNMLESCDSDTFTLTAKASVRIYDTNLLYSHYHNLAEIPLTMLESCDPAIALRLNGNQT